MKERKNSMRCRKCCQKIWDLNKNIWPVVGDCGHSVCSHCYSKMYTTEDHRCSECETLSFFGAVKNHLACELFASKFDKPKNLENYDVSQATHAHLLREKSSINNIMPLAFDKCNNCAEFVPHSQLFFCSFSECDELLSNSPNVSDPKELLKFAICGACVYSHHAIHSTFVRGALRVSIDFAAPNRAQELFEEIEKYHRKMSKAEPLLSASQLQNLNLPMVSAEQLSKFLSSSTNIEDFETNSNRVRISIGNSEKRLDDFIASTADFVNSTKKDFDKLLDFFENDTVPSTSPRYVSRDSNTSSTKEGDTNKVHEEIEVTGQVDLSPNELWINDCNLKMEILTARDRVTPPGSVGFDALTLDLTLFLRRVYVQLSSITSDCDYVKVAQTAYFLRMSQAQQKCVTEKYNKNWPLLWAQ
ncbi:unnamed protein product [Caenorhabditis auriculariae]|uniref:RING-type domain-containing protein n=1 Tax=Caenorhabditis auriculariae TaxID=2777116 RepID=A0A8S1H3H7_9PELO|nr:unnamed protein product [Caenorhabditis auriculariae]